MSSSYGKLTLKIGRISYSRIPDDIIGIEGKLYFYDAKLKYVKDVNKKGYVDKAIAEEVGGLLKERWVGKIKGKGKVELRMLSSEERSVTVTGEVIDKGYAYGFKGSDWYVLDPSGEKSITVYTDKVCLIVTLYDSKGNIIIRKFMVDPETGEREPLG